MLLLSRIIAKILSLLVVAQCFDNVVNGADDNSHVCCVHENCPYSSLDQCLANLTNNVLINITTDVTLFSIVKASNLSNISIIGHNYPTVNCKGTGGIHFAFFHNCSIQGITWDGCGSPDEPGLKFSYSSNVIIQNCCFQHLLGQAVMLLRMLGGVNIYDCNFINNTDYTGNGAAMRYSLNDARNNSFQYVLTIRSCNFSYNTMKSLIYLENAVNAILINSTFYRNLGISLYAINSHVYLIGRILFKNNSAENGAGIYIKNYSNIIFDKNSKVTFIQNSAHGRGGAVFLTTYSICLFDHNSYVIFNNNYATSGIIYSSVNSNVTFKATSEITFNSNLVRLNGAAIYSADNSHVTFKEATKVLLANSTVISAGDSSYHGGIIYSRQYSSISFEGNSTTVFSNNTAQYGGGIFIYNSSSIFFQEKSNTTFSNNVADCGGAIHSEHKCHLYFKENSIAIFNDNIGNQGGALSVIDSLVSFEMNSTTLLNNNMATYGGAMSFNLSNISFQDNSNAVFNNNFAHHGGSIVVYNSSSIFFQENSSTVFSNNSAEFGGDIYIELYTNVFFQDNSNTVFNDKIVKVGGGIFIINSSKIFFQGNSNTVFSNNTAIYGGGIFIVNSSKIFFQENSNIVFSNNTADNGGGILIDSSNIFFKETLTQCSVIILLILEQG